MKGTIIERGNSYQIRISLGKNKQTGKYDRYTETVNGSKPFAQKRLREVLTSIDKGVFVKPTGLTTGNYLQNWLDDSIRPNLAGRTTELYGYLISKHIEPALGNIPLCDLKPLAISHLLADKQNGGLSRRTVQLVYVCLHKALRDAVKHQVIVTNPADAITAPKVERKEMAIMSEGDISHFLEAAKDTANYALFYLLLFTGLRRGEALALRWSDIDFVLSELAVNRGMTFVAGKIEFAAPKTQKSRRVIALSPSTIAVLKEHLASQDKIRHDLDLSPFNHDDLVFAHVDGSPLLPSTISHVWLKLARKCGLTGIHVHSARHSHASLLLRQGVHPKIASERLGHAGIAITLDLYSHSTKTLQTDAANKFDDLFTPKDTSPVSKN